MTPSIMTAEILPAPPDPALLMVAPFAAMLASMAALPLLAPAFWERNYRRIAIGLGALCTAYYIIGLHAGYRIAQIGGEYGSFIVFIGSAYVICGGIHIGVKGEAKPWMNLVFLFCGALISNLAGTTGASMLLVRPWLRMNKRRFTNFHLVFFIFLVSNVGGCLTPIGNPPLFLGYLSGVPFWWVARHCLPAWLTAMGCLLGIFYLFDRFHFTRAQRNLREKEETNETWQIQGVRNFGFLALAVGALFVKHPSGAREMVMAAAALGSYWSTPRAAHERNRFNMGPIKEVAWLFAGIFATMAPALDYLQRHAAELGIREPGGFYWMTGALSGVLDNAPTYLAFTATAFGLANLNVNHAGEMARFLVHGEPYLVAISLGAVLFGAMTYIGNVPNLMVKSITEHEKMHAPDFFTYILKYSLPILLPVLILIRFLFVQ